MAGSLEAITGPVFSGKTSELSRRVRRAQIAGLTALVLQASSSDERRLRTAARLPELGVPVLPVRDGAEIRRRLAGVGQRPDVLAIDNAQELAPDAAVVCDALANEGLHVLVCGLDQRADGTAYPSMATVLALADTVHKLAGVCPVALCRERATRSQALQANGGQPPLFEERFEPRCADHFRSTPVPSRTGRRLRRGRLSVYAGCMFAGKTQELLTHYDRLLGARRRVHVVKPRIDRRYAMADVVTHDGVAAHSRPVGSAGDLMHLFQQRRRPQAIFIDEAQFLPGLGEVAQALLDAGIDVAAACLDLNYRAEPWPGIPELIARADECRKLHAICPRCHQPATRTQRLSFEQAEIAIGGAESYAPACRGCFTGEAGG